MNPKTGKKEPAIRDHRQNWIFDSENDGQPFAALLKGTANFMTI